MMRQTNSRRRFRGVTLMEMLVLLGILIILLSIFIPYVQSIWEQSRRHSCENNLRQIRDAMQVYARENDGIFPRVRYDAENFPVGYTAFTGADAGNPNYLGAVVQPNDVSASLFLLVKRGYITNLSVFICPSSSAVADTLTDAQGRTVAASQRSNFRGRENLSYSYASPFSAAPGYPLKSDRVPWDFALLADLNPGEPAASQPYDAPLNILSQANSPNHGKAGQNVLYGYGEVVFQRSPYSNFKDRAPGDNIYTARGRAITTQPSSFPAAIVGLVGTNVSPSASDDSYLVPAATDVFGAAPPPRPKPATTRATTAPATTLQAATTRAATMPATIPTTAP